MIKTNDFPILEFDYEKQAKIEPSNVIRKLDAPKACVISFFSEVIKRDYEKGDLKQISEINTETLTIPVYVAKYLNKSVGLVSGFVGAAASAAMLEELIAMGFEKFIVCGAAGVLRKDIQVGHLVVPYSAIRDEGTSYHYLKPSREAECSRTALDAIEKILDEEKIPYIKAKTWTTDAIYRETEEKINLRKSEGCVTVEMEAAAFFAVSKFRGVPLGQILYAGDDLSNEKWDARGFQSRTEIRENLVRVCLKIAASM